MRLLHKTLILGAAAAFLITFPMAASAQLVLTGAFDGPLTGGLPKGIELCATADIADLSLYGVGSANNGGGTDGEEFTFPADAVTSGTFLYVASDSASFHDFFGFAPDYVSNSMLINGDDAIEVFCGGSVIDVFGDINTDGTGEPWDHLDGWAYRVDGTGPDGSTFVLANWFFSGVNQLEGGTTNDTCNSPFPVGTYQHEEPVPVHPKSWGELKQNKIGTEK
jgi:hypothetical protein